MPPDGAPPADSSSSSTPRWNVSISAAVRDLDTTASGVQSAIALEALVSAAFILIGSKIADLIGRKRAFVLGLLVSQLNNYTLSPIEEERVSEEVRPSRAADRAALQIALLVPLVASLLGLLAAFLMTRLPDPKPSAAAEALLAG